MTLPETNLTSLIKYNDIKSKIKIKLIENLLTLNTSHSIINSNEFDILKDLKYISSLNESKKNLSKNLINEKVFIILNKKLSVF
jgi:hypothetical protein